MAAVNISNTSNHTLLSGTSGNDTIKNDGYDVTVNAGAGNDSVSNYGVEVTIDGSKGNDSVENFGNNVLISVSAGNDTVVNHGTATYVGDHYGGDNVTIFGGAGNDYISNVDEDDDEDDDEEYGTSDEDDDEEYGRSGDSIIIDGGSGDDTIYNGGSNVIIDGGKGADYISNDEDFNFSNVSINGGSGNDTIYIEGGGDYTDISPSIKNMTINGGAGADLITLEYFEESDGHDISINGGSGNDTITNETYNSTIIGGKGNDLISIEYARNNVIQYASGDGNDTVVGFNSDDTLQITEGSYTTVKSGKNLIVKVGDGSITLKDVSTAKIQGKSDNLPTGLSFNSDKTKITASKKFTQKSFSFAKYPEVQFFDGQKITNNVKITGNSLDNTIEGGKKTDTIYGGAGEDRVFGNGGNDKLYGGEGNDTLYGGGGDDTVTGGKGNDVFSYSSGDDVITDYTEKEDYIRLYKCSITGSSVKGKNVILKTTTGNITIKNGKGKEISVLTTQVYGNSTSKLFAEDNFMTADNISEIVAEKSVGEFKLITPEKISQENLITFAE